jgi:predicted alpha/beta superfamily hydrolase
MSKKIQLIISLFFSFLVAAWSGPSLAAAYQMPDTEMHVITSTETRNQEYMLYLQLPQGYGEKKNRHKKYPVVYVLDAYWDFPVIAGAKSGLVFDGIVPEFILVGIGYSKDGVVEEGDIVNTLRQIDYTPVQDAVDKNTGDAESFLGFIKSSVVPFIETNYRTDHYRVLTGTSWGGLFSLYSMFEDPGYFQGHIAITPAVSGFHRWAFVRESKFFSDDGVGEMGPSKSQLPVYLYMSVGTDDQLNNFTNESIAFSQVLKDRQYENFDFRFELKENEHHASVKIASFGQGLMHALSGYQE